MHRATRACSLCGSMINQQMVDRNLIYIHDVNAGNVLEVQIEGKRSNVTNQFDLSTAPRELIKGT